MVRLQTNGAENGVYEVTTVGSGSTNWVLTRTADASVVIPGDPDGLGTGDYFFTQEGVLNAGDSHVLTTEPNTMIIGYTTLTYTQFSGAITYTGGTNIDVTGQTISLTGTVAPTNGGTGTATVTTGDLLYGSATDTWSKLAKGSAYQSLMMDASGTNVQWNALALNQSNAVSGTLGATNGGTGTNNYATGDMLYSSAANTIAKLSGNTSTTKQYLSQTGTGAVSTAPSWATISAADIGAGTLPATRGGTDNSSYAVGDLLYANTTTSLAKLADVATGNALISGGVSAAPAWGKIGLTTHVSGTLGIANGGTNSTATPTAGGVGYGTGTANAYTSAGTSGQILTSAGASAPVWANNPPAFPSGTRMSFQQTTAPTGWTKDTTAAIDNSALRFVTGAASSGGSVAFTTAFASQSVTGSVAATATATATNQATTAGGSVGATAAATATNQATTATNQATTAGGSVGVTVSAGTLAVGAGTFAVAATTLATTQIPSHTHSYSTMQNQALAGRVSLNDRYPIQPATTGATGGGGSHTHSLSGAPSLSGSPSVTGTSFTGTSHNHTQDAHSHTQDAHSHTSGAFTGTSHNHTQDAHSHTSGAFTGTAINLAVKYYDFIIASKD
jgi:hypothetical protein